MYTGVFKHVEISYDKRLAIALYKNKNNGKSSRKIATIIKTYQHFLNGSVYV